MTEFADVEQFGREHSACGGITPSAAPQPGGGFLLTLTCACGGVLERWVTTEEAKRPLPLPRAAARAARPAAPSADLEAAIRAAVDAEEAPPATQSGRAQPPEPPPLRGDPHSLIREILAAVPAAPRTTSPAKLNLDTTIKTALTQQSTLKRKAAAGRTSRPRTRVVWLVLFAVVAFGAAAVMYFAGAPDTPAPAAVVNAPPPPLEQQQRAALDEIMSSLRTLQEASTPNASMSVYSSRVGFAKVDVDRFIGRTAPGPERTVVREIIDVHVLAAAAWTARALDQKDRWEAIGQDPAIDLCPSVKRVVDFATQPQNALRAQARGVAVASSIPLLWECAAAKIAGLDRAPAAE